METVEQFRTRVEAFLQSTGMAKSKLGRLSCNDPRFIDDMRAGMEFRSAKVGRVEAFMRGYEACRADAKTPANEVREVTVAGEERC